MAIPELRVKIDDGKGREKPSPDYSGSDSVVLHEETDYHNMSSGGYCWFRKLEPLEFLVLCCPFCEISAPVPSTLIFESKDPLTISEELTCGTCDQKFYVIKGRASKSWGGILEVT